MKKNLLCALAAALISVNATADVLYNNLYDASAGADPAAVGVFGPLADSFTTGASAEMLTDVQLMMNSSDLSSTGSFTVSLLADNGATPGALIADLATYSDSVLTNSNNVLDTLVSGAYDLAANTRYWIEVSGTSNSAANWAYDVNGNPATEFFANGNGIFTNENGPYQMAVSGTPVPEPASFLLMGLGFAGLLARRRQSL